MRCDQINMHNNIRGIDRVDKQAGVSKTRGHKMRGKCFKGVLRGKFYIESG